MKNYRDLAKTFLDKIYSEIRETSLVILPGQIDHLCYRTHSDDHYLEAKSFFKTQGRLLVEGDIGGRPIATYKLDQPIVHLDQSIPVIEIPSPKKGSYYEAGFEHFEVVIQETFDQFLSHHPLLEFNKKALSKTHNPDIKLQLSSGAIKFHLQTLEKVIKEELSQ